MITGEMTAIDTMLIYEDEVQWLFGALLARDKEEFIRRTVEKKRPRFPILGELLYEEEFLFDYMRFLKYGIKP